MNSVMVYSFPLFSFVIESGCNPKPQWSWHKCRPGGVTEVPILALKWIAMFNVCFSYKNHNPMPSCFGVFSTVLKRFPFEKTCTILCRNSAKGANFDFPEMLQPPAMRLLVSEGTLSLGGTSGSSGSRRRKPWVPCYESWVGDTAVSIAVPPLSTVLLPPLPSAFGSCSTGRQSFVLLSWALQKCSETSGASLTEPPVFVC